MILPVLWQRFSSCGPLHLEMLVHRSCQEPDIQGWAQFHSPGQHLNLTMHSDSDGVMGSAGRKLRSRNVVCLNNDLVACDIHKQPTVSASSIEEEYVVVPVTCKDGLSLYYFVGE